MVVREAIMQARMRNPAFINRPNITTRQVAGSVQWDASASASVAR
jgi:hypothetical protein